MILTHLLPSKARYGRLIEMSRIFALQHKAPLKLCAPHNNSSSIEILQRFHRSEDQNPPRSFILFIPISRLHFKENLLKKYPTTSSPSAEEIEALAQ
jgi:hypothetical protein